MSDIALKKLGEQGEVYHAATNGHVVWVDDEVIGFKCGCGNNEVLTLGIYRGEATECKCGARLYYIVEIVVKEA